MAGKVAAFGNGRGELPALGGALREVREIFAGAGGFEVRGRYIAGSIDLNADEHADGTVNRGERFGRSLGKNLLEYGAMIGRRGR